MIVPEIRKMANKPLRMAVLGVGYLGRFHAQKIKAHPKAELVGVYDSREEQGRSVANEIGVKAFSRLEDLFQNVDAVSIASTTLTHYDLAARALKEGMHVHVEKPMTATLEESEKLLALARAGKSFLTVGHIERFNPSVVWLKKEIKKKPELLRYIEFHRMAPFRLRGSDVSVIYDLMIHDLDLLYFLGESEIKDRDISGQILISADFDAVQGFFNLESGLKAFIHVHRAAPAFQRSLKVVFSDEVVFLNTQNHEIQRSFPLDPQAPEPMKIETIQLEKSDALADELDHFIRVIRGEISPKITAEDGLRAIRECEVITKVLRKSPS